MTTAPWRDVAYIGTHVGEHGGRAWRLVLDVCGHAVWRQQPPIHPSRAMSRNRLVLAPQRVRCTLCSMGEPHANLDAAIALAKRIDHEPASSKDLQ